MGVNKNKQKHTRSHCCPRPSQTNLVFGHIELNRVWNLSQHLGQLSQSPGAVVMGTSAKSVPTQRFWSQISKNVSGTGWFQFSTISGSTGEVLTLFSQLSNINNHSTLLCQSTQCSTKETWGTFTLPYYPGLSHQYTGSLCCMKGTETGKGSPYWSPFEPERW